MEHITLRDVVDAAVALSAAVSALLHIFGLDQKAWAKPILAASTDVVGVVKKLRASEPAPAPAPEQPEEPK